MGRRPLIDGSDPRLIRNRMFLCGKYVIFALVYIQLMMLYNDPDMPRGPVLIKSVEKAK